MSQAQPSRFRSILQAALRDEWDGLERINRDIRLADLFTLLNALMGLGALLLAAHGKAQFAIHLVLLGIIFDGMDGAVARLGKGGGPLGGVLDTLADACTFCATPAVVTFLAFPQATDMTERIAFLVPLALYFVCGLLRLARFESLRDDGKTRQYFSGIPTPAAAMTLLAMSIVHVQPQYILVVAFYLALLMVSRIRFPKLRGWGAVIALSILLGVLLSFRHGRVQNVLTWAMLGFMGLYVLGGPFFVLGRYGPTELPDGSANPLSRQEPPSPPASP